jgi:hypothetical protein
VTVQFLCPGCEKAVVRPLPLDQGPWHCEHCNGDFPGFPGGGSREIIPIGRCQICSGERFYLQRDFNQRIGCVVAGIGAILSPFTYGLSLVVCLLLDLGLYFLLKQVTVCYRCGAIYRGIPTNAAHRQFDLHVAEVEMQESKYLQRGSS